MTGQETTNSATKEAAIESKYKVVLFYLYLIDILFIKTANILIELVSSNVSIFQFNDYRDWPLTSQQLTLN